jgi:ABC-type polysaccharide/polyol phosphate export permease
MTIRNLLNKAGIHGYLAILREMVFLDFSSRYKNTIFGFFWSLLYPLLYFGSILLIYSIGAVKFEIPYFPLYLLLGIILFIFFIESTQYAFVKLEDRKYIMKNICFPYSTIIVSINITYFISLLLNLMIFFIFFSFYSIQLRPISLLLFLVLLLIYLLITNGVSFILSAMAHNISDFKIIWTYITSIGFFIVPIFYPLSAIPQKYMFLYKLNPVTVVIQYSRDILLHNALPPVSHFFILLVFSVCIFLAGLIIFNRRATTFPEEY